MYSPFAVSDNTHHPINSALPGTDADRVEALHAAMPTNGMFAEKSWRWSPKPFPLAPATVRQLEALGNRLWRFQRAANGIYHRSRKGTLPEWIAETLDRGKPEQLLEIANHPALREALTGKRLTILDVDASHEVKRYAVPLVLKHGTMPFPYDWNMA